MCGIAGELALDAAGQGASRRRVERMSDAVAARGPDGGGIWLDGHPARIAMAHRRLAIIDLSDKGAQPMRDEESGLCLVFNGIVYNWAELRRQLLGYGHRFTSASDTEALLLGWKQWGQDLLGRIDGVFAFAIWDSRQQRLYLARDRLGIKPLYFQRDGSHFRFCSSVQGLLASGCIDTELDKSALALHFSLHGVVPPPQTVLKNVRKLAPGHLLSIDASGASSTQRWWRLKALPPAGTAQQWRERTQAALFEAVRKRFDVSDTPVGVLLSGGLDSSLIVSVLARLGRNIKTYSIGFEDDAGERGSEFEYSDQVAERFETDHHKWLVSDEQVVHTLPEVVAAMTEPMPAQDCIGFYLLARRVSADVKLALSGQGADEVFAGYFWYPKMVQASGSDWERFAPLYLDHTPEQYRSLVEDGWYRESSCQKALELSMEEAKGICGSDFLNRLLYFDTTTLITDDPVKRVDNMCLASGLEARVPFLDADLLASVCAMPPSMKLASGGKGVLRDLARDELPADIIDRNKGYFPVPALKFLKPPFIDIVFDTLNSQRCRQRGLFRRRALDALMREPNGEASYTPLRGNRLWHYALFEMWVQQAQSLAASAASEEGGLSGRGAGGSITAQLCRAA